MVEPAANAEGGGPPDVVAPRQGTHNNNKTKTPQRGGENAGTREKKAEIKSKLTELILKGVAELQKGESEAMQAMVQGLRDLEKLVTATTNSTNNRTANNTDVSRSLREITQRLAAIEATTKANADAITPRPFLASTRTTTTATHPSTAPSWSQIAAGGLQQRASIELRLEKKRTDRTKETPEEQLARIQKAIPGAQAIITHPQSSEKISVLVSSAARRDQILQAGVQGLEGAKVIRRPRLVMVSKVSLHEAIKNRKCEENNKWMKKVQRRNPGLVIERVAWLYTDKDLNRRRAEGKQTKGSIVMSLATEAMQHQVVRQGLLVRAKWHPASMWDVSLTDGQCFRCHQWGHSQSVVR
jgi:hypothetical protein